MVEPRTPFAIGGVRFEAFPVQHSLRAPAVGYRVSAGRSIFFYVPDLAAIDEQRDVVCAAEAVRGHQDGGVTVPVASPFEQRKERRGRKRPRLEDAVAGARVSGGTESPNTRRDRRARR